MAEGTLRITLVRSAIGTKPKHRGTVRALGLRKLNQTSPSPIVPRSAG